METFKKEQSKFEITFESRLTRYLAEVGVTKYKLAKTVAELRGSPNATVNSRDTVYRLKDGENVTCRLDTIAVIISAFRHLKLETTFKDIIIETTTGKAAKIPENLSDIL